MDKGKGPTYTGQLVDYIKKNLKKGYTKESLKWALVNQGHSKIEIEKAFKQAEDDLAREAPIMKTKPEIKYEAYDASNNPIPAKKSFWQRFFG